MNVTRKFYLKPSIKNIYVYGASENHQKINYRNKNIFYLTLKREKFFQTALKKLTKKLKRLPGLISKDFGRLSCLSREDLMLS